MKVFLLMVGDNYDNAVAGVFASESEAVEYAKGWPLLFDGWVDSIQLGGGKPVFVCDIIREV